MHREHGTRITFLSEGAPEDQHAAKLPPPFILLLRFAGPAAGMPNLATACLVFIIIREIATLQTYENVTGALLFFA